MENLKLYEVDPTYIAYLSSFAPHLFHNKAAGQTHERKYIGILLTVQGMDYFAPLSSFKPKHSRMPETLDFIKIKQYAVININNMFPVPKNLTTYVDISQERDVRYRSLLLAEYRVIKTLQDKIRKNALLIYRHRLENGSSTALGKRCNDFPLLEQALKAYHK